MKIRNRFNRGRIITVHDELLSSLYELRPSTICYKNINGDKYLINSVKGKNFEIGLRFKINDKDLPDDTEENVPLKSSYNSESWLFEDTPLALELYYEHLCFSNLEKYITNVLLDKFLNNYQKFDISFLEIEKYYRVKIKQGSKSLKYDVAKKYAKTIDKLCQKEIFLITNNSFREKKYGVRNQNIYQPFLVCDSLYKAGKNNLSFSYSFGGFGKVIKQSRRYSTILSPGAFRISFNQLKFHLAGFYLAKNIFYQLFLLNKNPESQSLWQYQPSIDELISLTTEVALDYKKVKNPLRLKKTMALYIAKLLPCIENVISVKEEYTYEETEKFMEKHEFDYDIEHDLDNYEFSINDLNEDVQVEFTAILKDPYF